MGRLNAASLGLIIGLYACSDSLVSIPDPAAPITVTTPKSVYRWSDVGPGEVLRIDAILANKGTRDYYARLGDGFDAADEHSHLYVAAGSDAFLERAESSGWVEVNRGILFEGVKFVVLKAGSSYTLMTGGETGITGTYRIRVRYGEMPDDNGVNAEAVSQTFEIR